MGTKSSAWWEHKKVWSFCTFCPDYQHFLTFPVRYSGYGLNTIIKNLDKLSGIQALFKCFIPPPIKADFRVIFE